MGSEPKTLADIIRTELAESGLSQRAAARALGIDERLMRRYCTHGSDAPPYILMALRQLTQVAYNQQVMKMFDDGTLSASDGEASRERLVDSNAKLLKAIHHLMRRDTSEAGAPLELDFSPMNSPTGLTHVEPGDTIVDRDGDEGIVQHMLDMRGTPKCVCRVKKWTDSSHTHSHWRENVQFILARCKLVARA